MDVRKLKLGKNPDEAYGVLSEDWISKGGKSVEGFDLATLKTDLHSIVG